MTSRELFAWFVAVWFVLHWAMQTVFMSWEQTENLSLRHDNRLLHERCERLEWRLNETRRLAGLPYQVYESQTGSNK